MSTAEPTEPGNVTAHGTRGASTAHGAHDPSPRPVPCDRCGEITTGPLNRFGRWRACLECAAEVLNWTAARCAESAQALPSCRWCGRRHQPFGWHDYDGTPPGKPRGWCSPGCKAEERNARRRERRALEDRTCPCGETFTPTRKDAVYCSGRCRTAAHRAKGV